MMITYALIQTVEKIAEKTDGDIGLSKVDLNNLGTVTHDVRVHGSS